MKLKGFGAGFCHIIQLWQRETPMALNISISKEKLFKKCVSVELQMRLAMKYFGDHIHVVNWEEVLKYPYSCHQTKHDCLNKKLQEMHHYPYPWIVERTRSWMWAWGHLGRLLRHHNPGRDGNLPAVATWAGRRSGHLGEAVHVGSIRPLLLSRGAYFHLSAGFSICLFL